MQTQKLDLWVFQVSFYDLSGSALIYLKRCYICFNAKVIFILLHFYKYIYSIKEFGGRYGLIEQTNKKFQKGLGSMSWALCPLHHPP